MTDGRLRLVLDESPASRRAVAYVARVVGGQQRRLRFCLAYPSAPLPTRLLEFGGAENPYEEERLDARLRERQNRWTSKALEAAQQVLTSAQETLRRSGAAPMAG